jgi:hypothetical protein
MSIAPVDGSSGTAAYCERVTGVAAEAHGKRTNANSRIKKFAILYALPAVTRQ